MTTRSSISAAPEPRAVASDAQTAIRVQNLSKRFKIYPRPWGRATEWLTLGRAVRHEDFWALRDVSFQVPRGECFGIIGPNGSGKSTLLKLITGVLSCSQGSARIHGRVLSLLELGTGLNPQLTGRQNVVHSAGLMAFPAGYAEQKMQQIEAFAELGDFFDRTIRTYSSGMLVRLSFGMFACFDPDVFVVDEALSVGDVYFQQKCVQRIEEMRSAGTTLLFVSHDMAAVQRLCDRAIVLHQGQVHFAGKPEECVSRYYGLLGTRRMGPRVVRSSAAASEVTAADASELRQRSILGQARSRHGTGNLLIEAATVQAQSGEHALAVELGEMVTIRVLLRAKIAVAEPQVGLHLYDRLSNLVFAAGTRQAQVHLPAMAAGEQRVVTLRLGLCVQPGEYTFTLGCGEPATEGPDQGVVQDRHEGLGPLTVCYSGEGQQPFYGIARLPFEVVV